MFKAKLIDNKSYYSLRRKVLLYGFIPNIFIGIIFAFSGITLLYSVLIFLIIIAGVIIQHKTNKKFASTFGNKKIIIDYSSINIEGKKPADNHVFSIDSLDKIIIKESYQMPENSTKDIINEAKGITLKNFIAFTKDGVKTQYDFVVDSHYMLVQLDKIIAVWKNENRPLEFV
ncbi:MAG: hypothetical protein HKO89_03470 [Saprospiraceae bacterium]|nr:hypothetical protein [Saprospiraceae bacterium]